MSKGNHIDLFCIGTLTKHNKEYMWKDSEHEFHFGLAVAGFFRHCLSSETLVGDTFVHLLAAFIAGRRDTVERSSPLMPSELNSVLDDGPSLQSLTKILQLHTVDKEDCPFAAEVRRMSMGLQTLAAATFCCGCRDCQPCAGDEARTAARRRFLFLVYVGACGRTMVFVCFKFVWLRYELFAAAQESMKKRFENEDTSRLIFDAALVPKWPGIEP